MPRDFSSTLGGNHNVRDVHPRAQDRIQLHETGLCSSLEQQPLLTISIDDGHVLDFSTAELLWKFGLKATFYIPRSNPERPVMTIPQIRELGTAFDIGGHLGKHRIQEYGFEILRGFFGLLLGLRRDFLKRI